MTHRGKRSQIKEQKRLARHLAFKNAYRDDVIKETVCRIDREQILMVMADSFKEIEVHCVPPVFHGLVLVDGYGQGALQGALQK